MNCEVGIWSFLLSVFTVPDDAVDVTNSLASKYIVLNMPLTMKSESKPITNILEVVKD